LVTDSIDNMGLIEIININELWDGISKR
jgi:hypothetical protein